MEQNIILLGQVKKASKQNSETKALTSVGALKSFFEKNLKFLKKRLALFGKLLYTTPCVGDDAKLNKRD